MIDRPDYPLDHASAIELERIRAIEIERARWEGRMETEVKAMKESIDNLNRNVSNMSKDMSEIKLQLTHSTGFRKGQVALWGAVSGFGLIAATLLAGVIEHWIFH